MAIRLIDEYPGKVGAPTAAYPEGVPQNVTSPGGLDGTPWEEAYLKDIQGFLQGLLAQVPAGPVVPSGTPDTVLVSQYIDAMKLITQGLDIAAFANAEIDTTLRLAPDGLGESQWLLQVAEEMATAILNTDLVLVPDGLGGVVFASVPGTDGGLRSVQTFTSSGTWNRPAGITLIRVYVTGGGAAGAGGVASDRLAGAGGGAAATGILLIDVTAISSVTVTIGAAGSGDGGAGDDGGNSIFVGHLTAAGGDGPPAANLAGTDGGAGGGTPSTGDVKLQGGGGGGGGSPIDQGGIGGASYWGGGARAAGGSGNEDGKDGDAPGSGGSGGLSGGGTFDGGSGRIGIIVVEEYS